MAGKSSRSGVVVVKSIVTGERLRRALSLRRAVRQMAIRPNNPLVYNEQLLKEVASRENEGEQLIV